MVGDREHDVLGARAVGVRTIAVRWGYGSDEELAAAAPAWVVNRPEEIPDLIAAASVESVRSQRTSKSGSGPVTG